MKSPCCNLAGMRTWSCLFLVTLVCCEGNADRDADVALPDAAVVDVDVDVGDPQLPPRGQVALEAWLARGHHQTWRCEQGIFPVRLNGAHGRHRICSNALVMQTDVMAGGVYPVGAASVKELFDSMDRPAGYAVGIKIAPGPGNATWYWYERIGRLATLSPVADGVGVATCGSQCHVAAPQDNVFIRAPAP